MKLIQSRRIACAVGALALAIAMPAHADHPMSVDDAGTLPKGGAKLEFGWSKDDSVRGFDAAAGYAPVENLQLEIGLAQARDPDADPTIRARGVGLIAKWAPLQAERGLSAGLKVEYGKAWAKASGFPQESAKVYAASGLASWTFGSGAALHLNLGREWADLDEGGEAANTWGFGATYPVTASLEVVAEIFGAEESRPDRLVGLRYEVVEGVKVSAGFGRGNDRSFGSAAIAWEF